MSFNIGYTSATLEEQISWVARIMKSSGGAEWRMASQVLQTLQALKLKQEENEKKLK